MMIWHNFFLLNNDKLFSRNGIFKTCLKQKDLSFNSLREERSLEFKFQITLLIILFLVFLGFFPEDSISLSVLVIRHLPFRTCLFLRCTCLTSVNEEIRWVGVKSECEWDPLPAVASHVLNDSEGGDKVFFLLNLMKKSILSPSLPHVLSPSSIAQGICSLSLSDTETTVEGEKIVFLYCF